MACAGKTLTLTGGVIRVRKCLKALPDPKTGKRRLVLDDLKTEQSRRTIQAPRLVVAALRELRTDQARWRLKLGAAYDVRAMGLVFTDRAGALRWPQDVIRNFKVLCKRADIGEKWTRRELRHTSRCSPIPGWTSRRSPKRWGTSIRRLPRPSTGTRSPTR